ncbi:amidase family protein [Sphingomonas sp. TX0543]|uniref:amidase family protein n=1 Tax=unclassified Sphingomonas TaxID=196159 RepID=UPI0010F87248|nr:amidase family protein [Sphingomonas sp. 3P27F8]
MTERSALQTAAAVRSGESGALLETEGAIARIEARDGPLNAVVVRDFDRARHAAAELDQRIKHGFDAPLLGVPMTIKESYDLAGLKTTWGFTEHRDFTATRDAALVRRLKRAGAIILGKTNVPVGLADVQSTNPIYGRTVNPRDHGRVAGGSSGGSAVALATGMVPLEIGSDIGGSIRTPAAFNGVWGLKPTFGLLSTSGHNFPGTDGARVALSVCGPMARDADDLAAALDVLADHPVAPAPARRPDEWRILILADHPEASIATEMRAALEKIGAGFARVGASVDYRSGLLPDLSAQHRHYMHMLNIAMTRGAPDPVRGTPTLAEWFDLADHQARNVRKWHELFGAYDAVIAPVFGTTAFAHDDTPLPGRRLEIDGRDTAFATQFAWAGLATFPNLPATSVPVAMGAGGLPIGVQVIADRYQDHLSIAAARAAHDLVWSK